MVHVLQGFHLCMCLSVCECVFLFEGVCVCQCMFVCPCLYERSSVCICVSGSLLLVSLGFDISLYRLANNY